MEYKFYVASYKDDIINEVIINDDEEHKKLLNFVNEIYFIWLNYFKSTYDDSDWYKYWYESSEVPPKLTFLK